jgi:hypothetical protein
MVAVLALLWLVACFLLAPLFLLHMLVMRPLQVRSWNRLLERHGVDRVRVEDERIVMSRGGVDEAIDLDTLIGAELTVVDYCGEYAAANEFGALLELRRRSGEATRVAIDYYLDRDYREVIAPLRARGLLPEKAKSVAAPRLGFTNLVLVLGMNVAWGVLVALVLAGVL